MDGTVPEVENLSLERAPHYQERLQVADEYKQRYREAGEFWIEAYGVFEPITNDFNHESPSGPEELRGLELIFSQQIRDIKEKKR